MGGQPFLVLVLLHVLLLLCLLGSALQSLSLAQVQPRGYPAYGAARSKGNAGSIYGRGYGSYCDEDVGLPCEEMLALRTVINTLELSPAPYITRSFCSGGESLLSITIRCSCIGFVCHFTELDFSHNKLRGSIHEDLGKLSHLIRLDLSDNQLRGPIPDSLGNLRNLVTLRLYLNFLDKEIPTSLGNLASLVELNLWSNRLTGRIPQKLGYLSNLIQLRLDDNELSGALPPQLGNLSKLRQFWVTSNKLNGTVPHEYARLTNLVSFGVGGNNLSGPIPSFIANWGNLTTLNLLGNSFSGGLPEEIFSMKSLQFLWVSDLRNPGGFAIPKSANLKNLVSLILRNCNITGVIPAYIGDWSFLTTLDLSFNNLTGGIPDSVLNLDLSKMILTGNKLNGAIPNEINGVQYKADLSYNNFTFPEPTLKQMDLSHFISKNVTIDPSKINVEPKNRDYLYQIMDERCHKKKSKYHSLFINAGSETTIFERNHYDADDSNSSFYVSPRNWAYSCTGDFLSSTTNFSDYFKELPCGVNVSKAPLYAKPRLCPQSLTYYGFCLRNGNYTVKLHFAENIYARDGDHSSTGKRVFDIYIQRHQVLRDFNIKEKAKGPNKIWIENFTANVQDNLLEIRLFWAGKGSLYNPPLLNGPLISAISVTPEFKVGGLSHTKIAGIAAASIFIPLLLLAFMWRMGWLGHKEFQETLELRGKTYTVKQVIDATRKFSHKMEIGRGRFGILYKAELPDQTVAVKRLFLQTNQAIDQIGREVYTLKTVKHQNLLEFLDVYSKKDLHMLIYEYMEHGSLAHALFDISSDLELNWDTRFNICLGIAKGLKYLHEDSRLKIVHRNVKPSNILLDGELKAKISDFGLAKIYEEETSNVVIGAGDTLSYMAPEYATAKVVTEKADVYSFGIVLLEIVSGKKNADHRPNQESVYLIDDACVLHSKGKLVNLIDDKLQTYDRDQALDILNIAILCIDRSPTLRPTMSEVVSVLEGNKKIEELSKAATPST